MNNEDLLMNPIFLNKFKEKSNEKINYKFYKKRIYAITKQLLNNKEVDNIPIVLKEVFNDYIKNCVNYFEFIDTSDLLQNEYLTLDDNLDDVEVNDDISIEEINKKLISVKPSKGKIENFFDVYQNKPDNPEFPKQKNLNIKDAAHKKKGIKKKYN